MKLDAWVVQFARPGSLWRWKEGDKVIFLQLRGFSNVSDTRAPERRYAIKIGQIWSPTPQPHGSQPWLPEEIDSYHTVSDEDFARAVAERRVMIVDPTEVPAPDLP